MVTRSGVGPREARVIQKKAKRWETDHEGKRSNSQGEEEKAEQMRPEGGVVRRRRVEVRWG